MNKQDEAVKLEACPVGLFWHGDTLALKTEYGNNEGRIDAYIVSSGEFYWGDAPQTIASQRAQMVVPIDTDEAIAALRTTPANLNAPDKQEALAGEGVEGDLCEALEVAEVTLRLDGQRMAQRGMSVLQNGEAHKTVTAALRKAALSRTPSSPQADEADVERVARAICFADGPDTCGCKCAEDCTMGNRTNIFRTYARGAIAALSSLPVRSGEVEKIAFESGYNAAFHQADRTYDLEGAWGIHENCGCHVHVAALAPPPQAQEKGVERE